MNSIHPRFIKREKSFLIMLITMVEAIQSLWKGNIKSLYL